MFGIILTILKESRKMTNEIQQTNRTIWRRSSERKKEKKDFLNILKNPNNGAK